MISFQFTACTLSKLLSVQLSCVKFSSLLLFNLSKSNQENLDPDAKVHQDLDMWTLCINILIFYSIFLRQLLKLTNSFLLLTHVFKLNVYQFTFYVLHLQMSSFHLSYIYFLFFYKCQLFHHEYIVCNVI